MAASIARLIESGTPPSEIAVLYRVNAQSEVYEEALTEAGIAYQVRGGEGFFNRQEIKQALLALQRAAERGPDSLEGALPDVVRAVLEPLGLTAEEPAGTRARDRWEALTCAGRTSRRRGGAAPAAGFARAAGRATDARRRAAPTGGPGRHAGLAARGQGARMGCGVPGRAGRRHAAHLARVGARPRQRAASKRSVDCSTSESPGHECIWRSAGRWRGPRADGRAASRRGSSTASPRRRGSIRRRPNPAATRAPDPLPGLQQRPDHAGSHHAAAVRKLCRPTSTRTCCLALKSWRPRCAKEQKVPAVRRLHRQHADRDRRDAARRRSGADRDPGDRRTQARTVRPRRAGAGSAIPLTGKRQGQKIVCQRAPGPFTLETHCVCRN